MERWPIEHAEQEPEGDNGESATRISERNGAGRATKMVDAASTCSRSADGSACCCPATYSFFMCSQSGEGGEEDQGAPSSSTGTLSSSQVGRAPPSPPVGTSAAEASATDGDGYIDWLRSNGLPPGKVAIREQPVPSPLEGKDLLLRYVAAGEDLQAGDVALEVPMSLVVTLEHVLGDESVG